MIRPNDNLNIDEEQDENPMPSIDVSPDDIPIINKEHDEINPSKPDDNLNTTLAIVLMTSPMTTLMLIMKILAVALTMSLTTLAIALTMSLTIALITSLMTTLILMMCLIRTLVLMMSPEFSMFVRGLDCLMTSLKCSLQLQLWNPKI